MLENTIGTGMRNTKTIYIIDHENKIFFITWSTALA